MAPRAKPPAWIDSLRQLRALVSPVRQELIDLLQTLGKASIAELAHRLGRPADGLYYHVRALVGAGLVVPVGQRSAGRREEVVYSTAAPERKLSLRYRPEHAPSATALGQLVGSMLRTAERDFRAGLARAGVIVEGRRRELWAARGKGWLSPAELERVNALLVELGTMLERGPSAARTQLFTLTYVLAPAEARPARRGG
ncbi:MAG TPA: helix-turn-helix domain-containing protein [Kofleriaceae bacterium]|nr:helix-turn-helix domain-containing protein [Kofleriaceae bacterium]